MDMIFIMVNFLRDAAYEYSTGGHNRFADNIATRSSHTRNASVSSSVIVSRKINDVAMAVLPNAATDKISGLPVPTIAVATDGGTNVINHDGTITQGYQTIATEHVDLHPDGFMIDGISGATNDSFLSMIFLKQQDYIHMGIE